MNYHIIQQTLVLYFTPMGNTVFIGTSGYSYRDWVGPFYPPGTKQSEYLTLYAEHFNFVELNFSYYSQPEVQLVKNIAERVSRDFRFSIKAHQSLTHLRESDWKKEASVYRKGIEPLQNAGKLAAVLLQFPYSFHYTRENRTYLGSLCDELEDLPIALEFRSSEWQQESVYGELKHRNIAWVSVDTPALQELPEPIAVATSTELGYIRFHGRNTENWWKGTGTSRYDYLYSNEELIGWFEKIQKLLKETKILLIAFNNHYKAQAVKNAIDLGLLISERELRG